MTPKDPRRLILVFDGGPWASMPKICIEKPKYNIKLDGGRYEYTGGSWNGKKMQSVGRYRWVALAEKAYSK